MKYLLQVAAAQVQSQSMQLKTVAQAVAAAAEGVDEDRPAEHEARKDPDGVSGGEEGVDVIMGDTAPTTGTAIAGIIPGSSQGCGTKQMGGQLRSSGEFGVSTSNGSDEGSNEPSNNGCGKQPSSALPNGNAPGASTEGGDIVRDQETPAGEDEEQGNGQEPTDK
jgi:hypothetical protein